MGEEIFVTRSQVEFTLCFLVRDQQVLMLERQKEPNKGLWNGVGGHIEIGESPNRACIREIGEETGLTVKNVEFCGILSWESWYFPPGGMYIFRADPMNEDMVASDEGPLEWKSIAWVMQSDAVVSNISLFLPDLLAHADPIHYHCYFDQKQLLRSEKLPLPDWVNAEWLQNGCFRSDPNEL